MSNGSNGSGPVKAAPLTYTRHAAARAEGSADAARLALVREDQEEGQEEEEVRDGEAGNEADLALQQRLEVDRCLFLLFIGLGPSVALSFL